MQQNRSINATLIAACQSLLVSALMTINQRLMSIILRVIRLVSDGSWCEYQHNFQAANGCIERTMVHIFFLEVNTDLMKDGEKKNFHQNFFILKAWEFFSYFCIITVVLFKAQRIISHALQMHVPT